MNDIASSKIRKGVDTGYKEKYNYFLPKITAKKIPYAEHAANAFDAQLPLRPEEIVFCKRCVMSNQRPRIIIDEKGVCSACNYFEYKRRHIDWDKRRKQFEELLDQHRRKDGRYDVVVPCSGGKDSGLLAHKLKYEYGMHPLCVTWSPLLYSNIGFQNFQNMILAGLNSVLCSPNRILQRKLAKLCFVMQGDHFEAFSRGQIYYPFHVALDEGVDLVMLGENQELEYVGDTKNVDIPYNPIEDWEGYYHKDTSFKKLLEFGCEHGYLDEEDINDPSLKWYAPPPREKFAKAGIKFRWYGWYFNWVPQENYYYVAEHYNFQAMPRRSEMTYSKYASLDDLTDPFHFYMMLIKFGIGRATSDAAHEVRDGHLLRDEAVALVRRYDSEFPEKYFKEFLRYLDMAEEEFWSVVNTYRSMAPHVWEKVNQKWKLKCQVS
ncbi:MAG: N-acetyl sugar amidotransferase [Candidatus Omnitrophota bacterium]|nr:MAG: N-acetyl sugar amidotransferase [Candidatus Omnitrophota bacterium]